MRVETAEKLLIVEDFLKLEWPDDDEADYELIGGRVVPNQGTTSGPHGDIAARIATFLNNFAGITVGEKQTGYAFVGSSTNLGNPQGKFFPKPDVCFVLKDRLPSEFDEIPVAPDIVVEVNSPSDTDERRFEKLQAYQQAGVRLIWSINVLEKFVLVYRADEEYPKLLTAKDELDGGDVVPGFTLKVSTLFQK